MGLSTKETPDEGLSISVIDPLWERKVVAGHSDLVDGVRVIELLTEWQAAADKFVEDNSQGVEVGGEGVAFSFQHFRGEVMG